jgi:capsule polysaccharide export protein KpsE/RkpR
MKPERTASWYLYVVLVNRWFILKALAAVMIPTVIVTYILPRSYTVRTVVMPPETPVEPSLSIGGLGITEFMGYFGGGMGYSLPLMTTLSDVYVEILNSRNLIDRVILTTGMLDSLDLRDDYQRDPAVGMYWARKMFRENYEAAVTPAGFIEIEVTAGDPEFAVDVSERVVFLLDSLNAWVSRSRATLSREIAQMRLASAESLLAISTASLAQFSRETGVLEPDMQLGQLVDALAEMKRQYFEYKAGARAIASGYGMGGTAASLEMERRADAILGIIRQLESGNLPAGMDSVFPAVSMEDFAQLQFEYARLRSDYEMALQMSALMRISLQQSLVEERRADPTIRVLDAPANPGWKSKPKKILIWAEVFAITLAALLVFLFSRENVRHMRETAPEKWRRWQELFDEMKADFGRRRRTSQPGDSSSSPR